MGALIQTRRFSLRISQGPVANRVFRPSASDTPSAMNRIPLVDASALADDTGERARLDAACRDWGFFHLTGHGIAPAVMERTLAEMRRFFALPAADKKTIERSDRNVWGYYDRELTKNVRDWKEILDIGPAETTGPLAGSRPQWPSGLPGFREAIQAFYDEATRVSGQLLGAISTNLEKPADHLDAAFAPSHTSYLRLNFYPVCEDPAAEDSPTVPESGRLGISHHTDAGALTVLLHDDRPGLQVLHDGSWRTIEPVAGALLINIGDMVQVWSNDLYRAPLHRVLAHPSQPRYSAPFFYNPSSEAMVAPLSQPARYRPIHWGRFRAGRAAGDYADQGEEIQIAHFRLPC